MGDGLELLGLYFFCCPPAPSQPTFYSHREFTSRIACLAPDPANGQCEQLLQRLDGHANLLQKFLAAVLQEIGQIGQVLGSGQSLRHGREPAREAIKDRKRVQVHRLQAGVSAAALGFLPE